MKLLSFLIALALAGAETSYAQIWQPPPHGTKAAGSSGPLLVHVTCGQTGGPACTTTAANFTGVNLIVACISYYNGAPGTSNPSDSSSNTYSSVYTFPFVGGVSQTIRMDYVFAPTVTSSMTFTASATGGITNPSMFVMGFSGAVSSPLDQHNTSGGTNTSETSQQTGSVTPTVNNEILVACMGAPGASPPFTGITINDGFTLLDTQPNVTGGSSGGADAYLVQTTAAAINPTFSWTNGAFVGAGIGTFK